MRVKRRSHHAHRRVTPWREYFFSYRALVIWVACLMRFTLHADARNTHAPRHQNILLAGCAYMCIHVRVLLLTAA